MSMCRQEEFVAIVSAMQASENNGGAYDPTRKFHYGLSSSNNVVNDSQQQKVVTEECRARTRMLIWCLDMMDFFEIDRSIVAIAMYYQDRYLGTEKGRAARTNRSIFRIVSVTSLYMALKLSQPGNRWNITSHAFAKLCQGAVLGDEINDMEIDICSLHWIESSTLSDEDTTSQSLPPQELREHVHELVSYQLEVALHDKRLFQVRPSAIGTAVVLNALKGIQYEGTSCFSASFCQESIDTVLDMMTACNLISSEECIEVIRSVLLDSVVSSDDEVLSQEDDTDTEDPGALCLSSSDITRAETPPPQRKVRTPLVSSSPTSVFQVLLTNSAQARAA